MVGLERRYWGYVQMRAVKLIEVRVMDRMGFRVVVGLAGVRDRASLIENLHCVVVTGRKPQAAGKVRNQLVENVGGGHVTTRSVAVTTNAVVLPVAESRAEPSATPSPVELRM